MNFRNDAFKLVLLSTDAPFHYPGVPVGYPGPTFEEVIAAIESLRRRSRNLQTGSAFSLRVVGLTSGTDPDALRDVARLANASGAFAGPDGIDCKGNGVIDVPAGNPIICSVPTDGTGIGRAIEALVESSFRSAQPVALCQPVTRAVDNTSVCTASGVSIDAGSSDPQGLPLTIKQYPPGPYPEGVTPVTLRVENSARFASFCTTTVTVTSPDSDNDGVSDCKDLLPMYLPPMLTPMGALHSFAHSRMISMLT